MHRFEYASASKIKYPCLMSSSRYTRYYSDQPKTTRFCCPKQNHLQDAFTIRMKFKLLTRYGAQSSSNYSVVELKVLLVNRLSFYLFILFHSSTVQLPERWIEIFCVLESSEQKQTIIKVCFPNSPHRRREIAVPVVRCDKYLCCCVSHCANLPKTKNLVAHL